MAQPANNDPALNAATGKAIALVSKDAVGVDAWGTPRSVIVDPSALDPLDLAQPETYFDQRLDIVPPGSTQTLTRLQRARMHKEQGNLIFKKGIDYQGAVREYKRALHCMRRINSETRPTLEKELRIPCYLNLAACDLEMGNHAQAEIHATKVLQMDPKNVKALYRRAVARRYAARDLNNAVKKALAELNAENKRVKDAELKAAQRMFGGGAS